MMKRDTTRGRHGDHLVICDRSGFTFWASDTVKEWNGLRVYKGYAEARHPQDLLRSRRENFSVPDARPEPTPTFVGPLITELAANASAGAISATVVSAVRFEEGDRISIALDSADMFPAIVSSVPDSATLGFLPPLPGAASAGNKIINYTAAES